MYRIVIRKFLPALCALSVIAPLSSLHAADYYWNGTQTDWNDVTSWSTISNAPSPHPDAIPGASDIVIFHAANESPHTQNAILGSAQSILGLRTTNINTFEMKILGSGDQTLSLGASGIDHRFGGLTIGSASAGQRVNLTLMDSQSWISSTDATKPGAQAIHVRNTVSTGVAGTHVLTLTGINTGSTIHGNIVNGVGTLAIEKTGSGKWTLRGENTFSGGVTITQGTLAINTATALGTGTLTFNGGTIENAHTAGLAITRVFDKVINAGFIYGQDTSTSNYNLSLGATGSGTPVITFNNSVDITVKGSTRLTIAGHTINAAGHVLTKSGTGELVLGTTNNGSSDTKATFAGVIVSQGTLTLLQTGTSPDGFYLGNTTVAADATLALATNNNANAVTFYVNHLNGAGTITTQSEQSNGTTVRTLRIGDGNGSGNFSGTFTNPVNEDGYFAVTKVGTGTQVLSGNHTYTGATTISAGTLQVGEAGVGSIAADSTVTVNNAAASLAGTGTINGASVISNGFLRPGDSGGSLTGTITMAQLALNTNGAAILQIEGSDASSYDRIRITETDGLSLDGSISVTTSLLIGTSAFDTTFAIGNSFQLLDFTGNVSGSFLVGDLLRDGSGDNGSMFDLPDISSLSRLWDVSQFLTTGTITVVAVPEPSKTFLFLLGAWIIAQSSRRR